MLIASVERWNAMKRVLYISNIEVPYRVRFFNELAKYCDLTVLYESRGAGNRNRQWAKSESTNHTVKFLPEDRSRMNRKSCQELWKEVNSGYDTVIFGCCNSRIQMPVYLAMRLTGKPYAMNLDGEMFLDGRDPKSRLKSMVLRGASVYFVAGEKAAESIKKTISGKGQVVPYGFSSLSEQEAEEHSALACQPRNDIILVVGQYADYKGMDVALAAARMDSSLRYRFVGMGDRTKLFLQRFQNSIPDNVEIIPFLQKPELEQEYQTCAMMILPSRQECWGLVINEAASFGTPIVSTWGSGAALEYLADSYPEYLAKPGDAESLLACVQRLGENRNMEEYQTYLLDKTRQYTIENSVKAHVGAL